MPKVAYLTPQYFDDRSYVGGGERYPQNLALGVAQSTHGRYTVDILSFGPQSFSKELHPDVNLRVMKAAFVPQNPLDPVSWELLDHLRKYDLVHIMQAFTRTSEISMIVSKVFRKPVYVTDLGGMSSPLGQTFDSLELADKVVCYSDFGASLVRTTTPIVTIKGGVDARRFTPTSHKVTRDRVLYVGRLLPHKGIDQLIQALPPDLPLTCCGRPYNMDYFHRLQTLARGKRVEFVTDASDDTIHQLYHKAWANVLPSVYRDCYGNSYVSPELMGLTLLEAMACGTPAICNRVAAMPEFIVPGRTGFIYDTLPELTSYLKRLASDPELVERIGRKARQTVETEYDLHVCGRKLAAAYDQTLHQNISVRGAA